MKKLAALMIVLAISIPAMASYSLEITEVYSGISGADGTSDWIEVTNAGDTDWSGTMYYDDDSADPTKEDDLGGISTIAAGETVIILVSWEDDYSAAEDAIAGFETIWGTSSVQIGYINGGSGLGGSDAAYLFDGCTETATTLASATYSYSGTNETMVISADGTWSSELAVDGVMGAYESNVFYDDTEAKTLIGSPGVVPEPATLALLGLGTLVLRRKK